MTRARRTAFATCNHDLCSFGLTSLSRLYSQQARYLSLPYALHCSLAPVISMGANAWPFRQHVGVEFHKESLSSDAIRLTAFFKIDIPTIAFPLINYDSDDSINNYFLKKLAGK